MSRSVPRALVVLSSGALFMVLLLAGPVAAQSFTAGVRGAVRESGSIVPGVIIQLINEGTGATRETVSNDAGEYDFSAVPPGTYTVRAELQGFKTYERPGIRVATQQFVTVDVVLEIGSLSETITVTTEPQLVDTTNASIGSVLATGELNSLPSVARNMYMMSVVVPTVVSSGNQAFTRLQDLNHPSLISLGGGARRANNYLIDGVSHADLVNRPSVNPSFEAVESVNVQLHTYDAQTGRTGGGTYNVTARSGGNTFQGSAFYQERPRALVANNFFSQVAQQPKPNSYFHNSGGGIGGPIARNRTFFWYALEGYKSLDSRSSTIRVPTARERMGDFSRSHNGVGQLVTIYDPLTTRVDPATGLLIRDPFPGNVIPAHRLNPLALNILRYYPLPTRDVSNGGANLDSTADQLGYAVMTSGKIDHRFTNTASVSGLYITNKTSRTNENFWERGQGPNRFADPRDGALDRSLHLVALNNTWLPGNNTVFTLRYGYTRLQDDDSTTIAFDPSRLGFSQTFLNAMQVAKFPRGSVDDYEGFGAVDPTARIWDTWSVNGTLSRLFGRHTFKTGAEFRVLGVDTQSFAGGSGDLRFDRFYTSANPLANGTASSGNALASFLLGYPSGDPGNQSQLTVSSPFKAFVRYFGAFVQDDFRLNPKLTLNYGLRVEREDGLRERDDQITVGFDRTLNPGSSLGSVLVNGLPVRGGLMYAGRNGANTYQGDPMAAKLSPRFGVAYSFSPKTVVRGGYGVYWAPWNYQPVSGINYGQIGFVRQTFIDQGQFIPTTSLENPFPNGALPLVGNTLGPLTGVGGQIEFIDQNKRSPWVQQYSVDVERQVGGSVALGAEYVGASGRSLGLGGSNDAVLNINQLDPSYLSLGSALLDQVPNPFFGLPAGQGFAVTSRTVQRRQLLRPFPQFGDILMRQSTQGRSQYHALVFKAEKRLTDGWGGRINYTFSRLMDNQFGESNFLQPSTSEALNAYDVQTEYSRGLIDVPHKLTIAPVVELPFGVGKKWAQRGLASAILGGWSVSSIIGIESGFLVPVASFTNNTNLFTRMQRANPTGIDPNTSGDREGRILDQWLTPAGYTIPPPFTLGNAPRTDDRVRAPHRNNIDLAIARNVGLRRGVRGEFRLEIINLTNTVKVIGPIHPVGSAGFGQIRQQSGFMRIVQLMFRASL
ncbi:MAG: TonB-dependent receptor [Acidimicrobiia bacterium]|nr:TonB-dependent receptor [Acidimicrobiia bacterium]